jgi:histidinol-phosphate phosphatase family protein
MKSIFPPSLQTSLVGVTDLKCLLHQVAKSRGQVRAVFLDRDGTINCDRGYLGDASKVRLLPRSGKAINLLNNWNIPVIVVTNQSMISRNEITTDELEVINHTIFDRLRRYGAHYDALYYCPHDPTISPACFCRKPEPGLIFQAAIDFKIDLKNSFMVGDKVTDVQAGKMAGCKTVLIGSPKSQNLLSDFIAPNLLYAVSLILKSW